MLKTINMIMEAKKSGSTSSEAVTVDLHPCRSDYRGFMVSKEKYLCRLIRPLGRLNRGWHCKEECKRSHCSRQYVSLFGRNPASPTSRRREAPKTSAGGSGTQWS